MQLFYNVTPVVPEIFRLYVYRMAYRVHFTSECEWVSVVHAPHDIPGSVRDVWRGRVGGLTSGVKPFVCAEFTSHHRDGRAPR